MTIGKLPPKPDPVSGLPRPPVAPRDGGREQGHPEPTDRTSTPPDPPPGEGPVLEWTTRPWKQFFGGVALSLAIVIVFLTLRNGGLGWATYWTTWLVILVLSVLCVLAALWISGGLAAGVDWVRYHKKWVRTYELTEVKLGAPRDKDLLILRDAGDRELSIDLETVRGNPDLWNLVYNGMLHSVHHGATVNEHARERLKLDPQLHFIHDDEL